MIDLAGATYNDKKTNWHKIDNPDQPMGRTSDWLTLDKSLDIVSLSIFRPENRYESISPTFMLFRQPNTDVCHIGFKGSQEFDDMFANVRMSLKPFEPFKIWSQWHNRHINRISYVHEGFKSHFDALKPHIIRRLKAHGCYGENKKVIFYGHSLGGAIAQLAGLWGHNQGMKVGVRTVASPKAFSRHLINIKRKTYCAQRRCHWVRRWWWWWSWSCYCSRTASYPVHEYASKITMYKPALGHIMLRNIGDPVPCVPYEWMKGNYRQSVGTTATCKSNLRFVWRRKWGWLWFAWYEWVFKCDNSSSLWGDTTCMWQVQSLLLSLLFSYSRFSSLISLLFSDNFFSSLITSSLLLQPLLSSYNRFSPLIAVFLLLYI